ncbi:MAG: beta-N-acetylhexosaminidase [Rhodothermaceae bacterium]|nr:MAG: beta-N-acetylhexosaminidase [Rhodothermaceae bacterium]
MVSRLISVTLFLILTLTACTAPSAIDAVEEEDAAWVEATLARLTPEQKVAQLFAVQAFGHFTSVDDPDYQTLVDLVERVQVGGVIFFQGQPLAQALMANDLQARAPLPLLISQDMEWGPGMRIDRTTTLPRTMTLGATRDPALAYAAGYVTAREARALGVHQIFAPVADVNNNPNNPIINVRSFGEDPALVADMVAAFVRGARTGGVIATAKHFPGHGDTATDSHADLPVIPHDRGRLEQVELIPFRAAIEAGIGAIMTAHIAFPSLEPEAHVPGTLSPAITTGLLRRELGFGGLIVTDAMNMAGVTKHFGPGEAAIRALAAGADMVLMSEDVEAAHRAVLRALAEGRLDAARLDASVRRVLAAKARLGLHQHRLVDLAATRRVVGRRTHRMVSETIARRGLTLLRNDGNLLPMDPPPRRLLVLTLSDDDDPDTGADFTRLVRETARGATVARRLVDQRTSDAEQERLLREATRYDVVLVPAYVRVRSWSGRINLSEDQRVFLDRLIAQTPPVVLISFGNPYIVMGLARQPAAYLAAYGGSDASQKTTAQALFGQSDVGGRLPVTIPGLYAFGDGLRLEQTTLRPGYPEEVGMDGDSLARVDTLLRHAIERRAFPGAALAVGRDGVLVKRQGYGYFTYDSEQRITPRSRFDLASLTKVVATTTAAMLLYEDGRLDLDAPVVTYLPEFGQNGKEHVTIRQLLTHTSGLIPFRPFHRMGFTTREQVLRAILADTLVYRPGTETRYSDFNMIVLALVIERITGQDFATFTREAIFEPLGMHDTGFLPVGQGPDTTVVPTEYDRDFRKRLVQGEVHDETAYLLGGVAGHAGLFSTADDLALFAYMLTNGGTLHGRRFLRPETIRLFTTRADPTGESTRALGWDTKSPEGYSSAGHLFGPNSFGHTGFTGTSLWIDPDRRLFVILLTNRVYPTRENRGHIAVRAAVADLAAGALRADAPLLPVPGSTPAALPAAPRSPEP